MSALTIVVDVAATTGGEFLLTGFRDVFAYVNGVKTDQWEGVAYSVVLPKVAYNALTVKVIGKPAQIQAPQQGEVIPVRFDGLVITPYVRNGRIELSAKANSISVVTPKA